MKITGTVHCFFEQSGTFKNEFKALGINAIDYDIKNEYGETDKVIDLFSEIEKAYSTMTSDKRQASVFDNINSSQDLIFAFFPCIYFCEKNQNFFELNANNFKGWSNEKKIAYALDRNEKRNYFYQLILKLYFICSAKKIRLIIENPYSPLHYLAKNFPPPSLIDKNRTLRGDVFKKPTQYWYLNCEPTLGETLTPRKQSEIKTIRKTKTKGKRTGECDRERSEISPLYAHNFICDFILGQNSHKLRQLHFDFD